MNTTISSLTELLIELLNLTLVTLDTLQRRNSNILFTIYVLDIMLR